MKNPVNIFFACDDGYIPFVSVALTSLKANCDPKRIYDIRILHTGINKANEEKITSAHTSESFNIYFCDVSKKINDFSQKLHTRDYYSKSTYYRLFIPTLFPDLDKALYLDADIAIVGDISKLFDIDLENNLVGAVADSTVPMIKEFSEYVKNRLDVDPEKYFNAGILLMNLSQMRKTDFEGTFLKLIDAVKFNVAQDQDYLNVICKDKTKLLSLDWNTMPFGDKNPTAKLIHYNLDAKPWHKSGILYEEIFWNYANSTVFSKKIAEIKGAYTVEMQEKSARQTENLIMTAAAQAMDEVENLLIHQSIAKIFNNRRKYEAKRRNQALAGQTCRA